MFVPITKPKDKLFKMSNQLKKSKKIKLDLYKKFEMAPTYEKSNFYKLYLESCKCFKYFLQKDVWLHEKSILNSSNNKRFWNYVNRQIYVKTHNPDSY